MSCYCITRGSTEEVADIRSTPEDTNTRLLIHAAHASRLAASSRAMIVLVMLNLPTGLSYNIVVESE